MKVVNFKPGDLSERLNFSASNTGTLGKRNSECSQQTYELPNTTCSLDALPLSYRRLAVARTLDLEYLE